MKIELSSNEIKMNKRDLKIEILEREFDGEAIVLFSNDGSAQGHFSGEKSLSGALRFIEGWQAAMDFIETQEELSRIQALNAKKP